MNLFDELLLLLGMFALLGTSGFFSGSETALFSLSAHQRLQLGRAEGIIEKTLVALLDQTRSLLITLMLGNMVVNVLYFALSTVLLLRLQKELALNPGLTGLLSPVPLVMIIMGGEVLPKMVAARVPMPWSRFVALPMMAVHRLIYPVRVASNLLVITPLARLIAPSRKPPELSPEELEAMLKLSQHRGIIDRQEESTLQQVLTLGQIKVRDLMTPRVDVVAFDALQGPEALLSTLRDTRFNHVPVYEGHLDNVLGVIHARQALLKPPASDEQLRRMIKQVRFVPELQRADKLLLGFRKRGTTLAIVVDEYGGTAGLVTLHDVVELMVGQIIGPDESQQVPSIEQESPGLWRVSADLPLQSFAELFGPTVAATGGAVLRTLGGLVMARLGRLPTEGEAIELGNLRIEVAAMSGHRIDWLWVRLMDQKAQPQQPPATQIQRGVG